MVGRVLKTRLVVFPYYSFFIIDQQINFYLKVCPFYFIVKTQKIKILFVYYLI